MTRKRLNEIFREHLVTPSEIGDVLEAVSDVLEELADETERNEPYAKDFIRMYRKVASDIRDPDDLIAS